MADKDLQAQVDSILSSETGPVPPQPGADMAKGLAADTTARPRTLFSAFVDEHMERASELASKFIKIADEQGLAAAVEAISAAQKEEPVAGLVQYALQLFLTHHPEARATLKLKPLEVRQPNLVRSSTGPAEPAAPLAEDVAAAPKKKVKKKPVAGATPLEDKLNHWREDPLLNEHHEHWHLVYPLRPVGFPPGTPKPEGGFPLGSRHGELFAYMHQQMLARYDAERLSAGVPRVKAFDTPPFSDKKFTARIPEGYDPGPLQLFIGGPEPWYPFRARPANAVLSDITLDESTLDPPGTNWAARTVGARISDMVKFGNALHDAIKSGNFDLIGPDTPLTIDTLGSATEPSANSVDAYGIANPKNFRIYGSTHNDGHVHFMIFDNIAPYGVMAVPATAVRDPVFFRWHKLVDDLFFAYQLKLEPYDFSGGPPVRIRTATKPNGDAASKDIILCRVDGLPDSIQGHKFGSRAYSNLVTGAFAEDWNRSFASGTYALPSGEEITTTDVLTTEMKQREIMLRDAEGNPAPETVEYLAHDDFYYFLRVENTTDQEVTVAVRIFLAPETEIEDRRAWIEMDRFTYRLRAAERAVIFRPADESSVIRKPALKPDDLTADDGFSPVRRAQPWCDCGWPYTLLLPRGTKAGMKFRLLVMCSDGKDLEMPNPPDCCTSISYCGLQDVEYPDKAAMGYPFDRKFKRKIKDAVEQNDNWAWRTIKIRCRNP